MSETPTRHNAGAAPSTDPARSHDTDSSGTPAHRSSTSVAAVFALVFVLIAILAALTGLLAPVAVVFGLIGLVLGIVGMTAGQKPLKAGKGVAIGGLVLSVLDLLLGLAAIIGVASAISSNSQNLDQIGSLVDSARSRVGV